MRYGGQYIQIIFVGLIAMCCSCQKENNPRGSTGTGIGIVTKKGTPLEAEKTSIIGAGGGSITSRDGKLRVQIPAGALSGNTTIGVTAISSTSAAARGNSYRLTPDIQFAKPVTISISYDDYKDSITGGGCGVGIGYQDSAGVWQLLTNRVVDEQLHRVSIKTDHFSDWAFLTPFELLPAYSLIRPGEEVRLRIGAYVRITESPCSPDNPNNPQSLAVEEYYEVPDYAIGQWISLAGETTGAGTLKRNFIGATYSASTHDAPAINPVQILALFPKDRIPLISTIKIRPVTLSLTVTVANTTYIYDKAYAFGKNGDAGIIWQRTSGNKTYYGNMSWIAEGTGVRNWSDDTQFLWEPEDSDIIYQSFWDDGLKVSSGAVNITHYGKEGQIVEGTFSITNAGVYQPGDGGDIVYKGVKPIKGTFRVIRE